MTTSVRAFRIGLYEEHLEEGSFLYEQRRVLQVDPEMSWMGVGDFEQRLEAHIDALMVGGHLALEVSREHSVAPDPGELFMAVCVFCRHGAAPLLAEVLRGLDYDDSHRVRAVLDALKYELPDSWRAHCLRAVSEGADQLKPLLARVLGYRRVPASAALLPLLEVASSRTKNEVLWAVGRTREAGAVSAIRPFYDWADRALCSTALRTGLRFHDVNAQRRLYELAPTEQCFPLDFALAGSRSAGAILLEQLSRADPPAEVVTAVGLLGDLSVADQLIRLLTVSPLATAAAEALHVITGAPLFEDVFVPDNLTVDELFDKELRAYRETGELPNRGDGQPFGSRTRRLSVDSNLWGCWLLENATRFKAELRYRMGQPCTAEVLLRCLSSETFPKSYRALVGEELLVRYGIDLPFEVDMPVAWQRAVFEQAAVTMAHSTTVGEPGGWHAFGPAPGF